MEKPNISTQSQTNLPPKPELTPSFSSPTPKFSPPLIATFVLFLVLVGAISFFLGKSLSQPKSSPPPISQVSPSPSPSTPTPTPDPTANWKTYTNYEVGFLFKHPQTLVPSECKEGLHLFEINSGLKSAEYCETPPYGKISILFSKSPLENVYGTDFEVEQTQIKIAGINATKDIVKRIKEAPGPAFAIFVTFKKGVYYFRISVEDQEYEKVFDLILSTFKYLD